MAGLAAVMYILRLSVAPAPTSSDAPAFISRQVLRGDYYFLDLDPPKRAQLAVVCGGREECGPGYVVDRPSFPFLSISG